MPELPNERQNLLPPKLLKNYNIIYSFIQNESKCIESVLDQYNKKLINEKI